MVMLNHASWTNNKKYNTETKSGSDGDRATFNGKKIEDLSSEEMALYYSDL